MMNQKRVAAEVLKCGVTRIKILDFKQAEEAITRQDIRNLVRKGVIVKVQKKGTSKGFSKHIFKQKKKGRRGGLGNRRGTFKTRTPKKDAWMRTVRPLRRLLKELVSNGQIEKKEGKPLYAMIKGGAFRSKSHLLNYLTERRMLKKKEIKQKKGTPKKL